MDLETTNHLDSDRRTTQISQWLVSHYYDKGKPMSTLHRLSTDESLGYLPWTSIAMEINKQSPKKTVNEPEGHVFCFLPFPLEKRSVTGLPFHVHGYFAVEENRRHLKWPSAEQNVDNLTDKALLWNMNLIQELLPCALSELLKTAKLTPTLKAADVYAMIPNPDVVDCKWQFLLPKLFNCIFQEKLFHAQSANTLDGFWVDIRNAVFCSSNQEHSCEDNPEIKCQRSEWCRDPTSCRNGNYKIQDSPTKDSN